MKPIINLLTAAAVLGTITFNVTTANAQFYVGARGGYNVGTTIGVLGTTNSLVDTVQTNIYGTRGGGTNVGLTLGFMLNDYLGFDLAADYFMNTEVKTGYSESQVTSPISGVNTLKTTTIQVGTQLRLTPSVVVMTGRGKGFGAYGRFGSILPVGGESIANINTEITNAGGTFNEKRVYKAQGQGTFGFSTALGARYGINEHIDINLEVALTTLNIRGASAQLTTYESTVPGAKTLDQFSVYDRETIFVDALSNQSNNKDLNGAARNDMPKEDLVKTTNYSAIGGNLGVRYKF